MKRQRHKNLSLHCGHLACNKLCFYVIINKYSLKLRYDDVLCTDRLTYLGLLL